MPRKSNFPVLCLVLAMLVLTSLACNLGSTQLLDKGLSFDVRLTEEQLNAGSFNMNVNDFLSGEYSFDLQPGKVVLRGRFVRPNGSLTTGSADIGISAENGALQVTILSVDAAGIDLSDEHIQNLQAVIARALSQAFQDQDVVTVESVEITDDEIIFQLRGKLPSR
jgi:hypothetical protein